MDEDKSRLIVSCTDNDEKASLDYVPDDDCEKKPVCGYLYLLLVLLGVTEWSAPSEGEKRKANAFEIGRSKFKRRVLFLLSFSVQLVMTLSAVISSVFYLYCYFGMMDHFLRFVAILCYWPSLVSSQLVCMVAVLKRRFERPKKEDEITWAAVFSEAACGRQFLFLKTSRWCRLPKLWVFVFVFLPFPTLIVLARILLFVNLREDCRNFLQCVWTAFECIYVFIFASFCYFLYLKRVLLEDSCARTADYVRKHCGHFNACLVRVRLFFKDYAQLRRLLLPWLTFVLLNSTFGITVVVTWNYQLIFPSNETTWHSQDVSGQSLSHMSETEREGRALCPYSCDKISFVRGKQQFYVIYNMLVVCRHLMTAFLSCFVVGGLDLKYIWDRFRLKFYFMCVQDGYEFWKKLKLVVDSLHPQPAIENFLALLLPMMGLATALLSGNQENF